MTETVAHRTPETHRQRLVLPLVLLGIGVAVAAGAVAWLLFRADGGTPAVPAASGRPMLLSQHQLERFAASVDHPVYWAGPRRDVSYELTATPNGRIFVRYLPRGVEAGDARPNFLTVGTYPGASSFADLKRAANREGAVWIGLGHGGLVVYAADRPQSVYLGYPGGKYQIEVYAPAAKTARGLVLGGTITPIP